MNNLSTAEKKVFDYMSMEHKRSVLLGTKIDEIITTLGQAEIKAGTPVNAVNATKALAISGVVVDGETVTINNPATVGTDVYEFLADAAQSKSDAGNIAVDISSYVSASVGTLTVDTKPTSGDTMTIGSKVYIFVPVGTANADGEIAIGADAAGAQVNIVAAINGTDDVNAPHPSVRAGTFAANASEIVALVGGVAGDAIATTETFTAGTNVFGAATLGSGADCSAANAVTALVAAITASDTQGVDAADGTGDTVDLTATIPGVAGNAIIIGETMANGAFAGGATTLSGGVNGTVGLRKQAMSDASYLYICVADNTITGKNWRRISVGSAY